MEKASVVLVAFYNVKALGVRYLESALEQHGYRVVTVFFKDFNSLHPQPTNEAELTHLTDIVARERPLFVGLSVMSSMYLETVEQVIAALRRRCPDIPCLCGGAYATMFPQHILRLDVQFVIRADGERAICRLADALLTGGDYRVLPSLCYREGADVIVNPIGDLLADIDGYGLPAIVCREAYFIEHGACQRGDPQVRALSYEVIASRGCPFSCSYCCSVNLRRLFPKGTPYVRTRSVESVIAELEIVKKTFHRLVFIHFYDEIFPNQPGWVDEFVRQYRARIRLPFTIWSHPQVTDQQVLEKLVAAGLTEVIMGIQSGSPRVRSQVFHRYESQREIIDATRRIRRAGVPWASYDLMLQHPFESIEDLQQSYELVKRLEAPFELQLHGLNFLPGTDIVSMAVQQGIVTQQRMDEILYAPMSEQFRAYWKQENDPLSQLWYRMIYCLQFPRLRARVQRCETNPMAHRERIDSLYQKAVRLARLRYYIKKSHVVWRRALRLPWNRDPEGPPPKRANQPQPSRSRRG